ncbi:MAG: hypothetical protein IJG38_00140 [Thermoguttaceae bacterium]|nr:hypothetical protein [Thermoguttaceae bacterium]MBQ3348784.1 hypothetical protein [Thermoguttaceae bacterium]
MFNATNNALVIFRFFGNTLDGIAHTTTAENFTTVLTLTKELSKTQPGTFVLAQFTTFEPPFSVDDEHPTEFLDFQPLVGCKDGQTVDNFHGLNNIDGNDDGSFPILFISPSFWECSRAEMEAGTH